MRYKISGGYVLVDDDFSTRYKNIVIKGGYATIQEYRGVVRGKKKYGSILLHRVIMRAPKGMEVDHINGDKLDCRKSNMRICTRSDNAKNVQSSGCTWHAKSRKWQAQIIHNGKTLYLGLFRDRSDAIFVRNKAAKKLSPYYRMSDPFDLPVPKKRKGKK